MSRYEVAFSGELLAGAETAQVRAGLARLFQADEQRLDLLFSGRRIVIKNDVDAATAEKYREGMARVGARVEVRELPEMREAPKTPVEAPASAESPEVPAASGRLQVAPRDPYMAAFADVDAPDFGIAPPGADLLENPPVHQAPLVDLSQFSLAPAGSDMGQIKAPPAGPAPDTSHIKLQE
jgi:hypothetical protein